MIYHNGYHGMTPYSYYCAIRNLRDFENNYKRNYTCNYNYDRKLMILKKPVVFYSIIDYIDDDTLLEVSYLCRSTSKLIHEHKESEFRSMKIQLERIKMKKYGSRREYYLHERKKREKNESNERKKLEEDKLRDKNKQELDELIILERQNLNTLFKLNLSANEILIKKILNSKFDQKKIQSNTPNKIEENIQSPTPNKIEENIQSTTPNEIEEYMQSYTHEMIEEIIQSKTPYEIEKNTFENNQLVVNGTFDYNYYNYTDRSPKIYRIKEIYRLPCEENGLLERLFGINNFNDSKMYITNSQYSKSFDYKLQVTYSDTSDFSVVIPKYFNSIEKISKNLEYLLRKAYKANEKLLVKVDYALLDIIMYYKYNDNF